MAFFRVFLPHSERKSSSVVDFPSDIVGEHEAPSLLTHLFNVAEGGLGGLGGLGGAVISPHDGRSSSTTTLSFAQAFSRTSPRGR